MIKKPFIIACIPAFNEEKKIAGVILLTQKYVDKVIVCNDGSSDQTGEIASLFLLLKDLGKSIKKKQIGEIEKR